MYADYFEKQNPC